MLSVVLRLTSYCSLEELFPANQACCLDISGAFDRPRLIRIVDS